MVFLHKIKNWEYQDSTTLNLIQGNFFIDLKSFDQKIQRCSRLQTIMVHLEAPFGSILNLRMGVF